MASSMCACLHAAITPPVVPAGWLVWVPQVLCCDHLMPTCVQGTMALEVFWRGGKGFPVSDGPPVYPWGVLTHHVLFKGAQFGSTIGLTIGPVYACCAPAWLVAGLTGRCIDQVVHSRTTPCWSTIHALPCPVHNHLSRAYRLVGTVFPPC